MSGVNDISVAGSALELWKLFCELRPKSREYETKDQIAVWRHKIISSYFEKQSSGNDPTNVLTYHVPKNFAFVILHIGANTQPESLGDPELGETPFNYGDFRSNYSLNPYGDFGAIPSDYPQMQIVYQTGGEVTPLVPSHAMQAQQVLVVVPANSNIILQATFAQQVNTNLVKAFFYLWGWFVPTQVGNILSLIQTNWEVHNE